MWCVERFGIICTILKNLKNSHGGVLLVDFSRLEVAGFSWKYSNIKSLQHGFAYLYPLKTLENP